MSKGKWLFDLIARGTGVGFRRVVHAETEIRAEDRGEKEERPAASEGKAGQPPRQPGVCSQCIHLLDYKWEAFPSPEALGRSMPSGPESPSRLLF